MNGAFKNIRLHQLNLLYYFLEIFTPAYSDEWTKNREFIHGALKTFGVSREHGESNIVKQADNIIQYFTEVDICVNRPMYTCIHFES